jgi:aminoglycoside phosphotransferase (APT) family kinase protein
MTTSAHSGFDDSTAQRLESITTGAEPAVVGPLLAEVLHDPRWATCDVALISGGKSNLTYRVASDAGEVVLRRPPLGHILPTAHDMVREHRVLAALQGSAVPVPRVLHLGDADGPLGAPFYVMERVVGHVCRNGLPPGYADSPAQRAAIGVALVDTLADLHAIDPAGVGLGEFGRPAGFMERQLRRWSQQWEASKAHDHPALDELRDELVRTRPEQRAAAIVHGDYRLDNAVLHPTQPGRIVAVLDWEMSTLGDPLADLGALLAYWSEAGDDGVRCAARIVPPVTAGEGFPTRAQVVARYAQRTGFEVSDVDWYQAFAFFKLAVVCQGIATRAAGGAMLGSGFDEAQRLVAPLVAAGRELVASLSGSPSRRPR